MSALPLPPGQAPRAWQLEALAAARDAIKVHQAVIVSAATGTGKGSLIAGMGIRAARNGKRVLMLAHREELLDELAARVRRVPGAPDVGIVKGARNEMLNPVVVGSVQSLGVRRLAHLGRVDLVLTDECHHALAPSYGRIYDAVTTLNPNAKHVGFTATPFRTGRKAGTTLGLGQVYQAVAYEYGIADAIAAGDLVPPRGFRVATDVSLEGVHVGADGDFVETELSAVIDVPDRNELIVREYLSRCPHQPALVFCVSIEHSQHMAEALQRAGVRAEAVWGVMPAQRRRELIRRYRERDGVDVLCSRDLLFEGFDAPATVAIFQARPTQSRVVFTQMVGRGLRLHPGKTECAVVSFVDRADGLDLATLSDLSPDDPPERTSSALGVGDPVVRRRVQGWGVGVVQRVDEDEEGGRLFYVRWPASEAHPSTVERPHVLADLARAPTEEEPEDNGTLLAVQPRVAGVRVYEVLLLPGASPTTSPGWYEYHGTWSCAAALAPVGRPQRQGDGTWRPAERPTVAVHVRQAGGGLWEAWSLSRVPGRDQDEVTQIGSAPDHLAAMRAGEQWLAGLGARPTPHDADWKAHPASDKQLSALRSWGIWRDTSKMSKGEASALLDAVRCRRLVAQQAGAR